MRLLSGAATAGVLAASLLAACGGPVTEGGVNPTGSPAGLAPVVSPSASCTEGADSTVTSTGTPDDFHAYGGATYTKTADGLQYADVVAGTGATVQPGQCITVQYTGWLADGTKFDSSRDRTGGFQLIAGTGGQVIVGWQEGIPGMKVGARRRLVIPAALAYGAAGQGAIPANATLTFDIEVLRIH